VERVVGDFRLVGKNGDGLLEVCGVPLERRALSRLLKTASRIGVFA